MTRTCFSRLLVLVPVTVCATISYVNQDSPRCNDRRPPPQILGKCHYDDDCMENAYCWNQRACLCKDDFIVYRNHTSVQCLKVASAIGDPCQANVQCHVTFALHSECRINICQCSDDSHFEEGRCYKSVGIGHGCLTNRNCYIKDSFCVSGMCTCILTHHPNPDNDRCIQSARLGDKCSNDYECVGENLRCIKVCSCTVDHVLSSDGKQCLKAANFIGESCLEDSQCQLFLNNTACGPNGKCRCIEHYHQRGLECLRNIALHHRCQSHRDCVTETYKDSNLTEVMNVDCINNTCVCAANYAMTEELHDCVRYSESGATLAASRWQFYEILCLVIIAAILTR